MFRSHLPRPSLLTDNYITGALQSVPATLSCFILSITYAQMAGLFGVSSSCGAYLEFLKHNLQVNRCPSCPNVRAPVLCLCPLTWRAPSFYVVRIWKCQYNTSGDSDGMLTLYLVSQKNAIITATLVSILFTLNVATLPLSPHSPYLLWGSLVCMPVGIGETIAHSSLESQFSPCVRRQSSRMNNAVDVIQNSLRLEIVGPSILSFIINSHEPIASM